jgi:hypothetical protein
MFRAAAVAVAVVVCAALALPSSAMAGDEEYVDVVQSQLDAVKDFARSKGYSTEPTMSTSTAWVKVRRTITPSNWPRARTI